MFNTLFGKKARTEPNKSLPQDRPPGAALDTQLAASLLIAHSALIPLTLEDAAVAVGYMQPRHFTAGTVFIHEGDDRDAGFMALVLDGDVLVEGIVVERVSQITVTVLGPGSILGDLSLINGPPRSASCTACTDLTCAILTRASLRRLIEENPLIGAKLMLAIAARVADRLRDNTEKLKKFVTMTRAMQQEIESFKPEDKAVSSP